MWNEASWSLSSFALRCGLFWVGDNPAASGFLDRSASPRFLAGAIHSAGPVMKRPPRREIQPDDSPRIVN
jgi:hypothetical protein